MKKAVIIGLIGLAVAAALNGEVGAGVGFLYLAAFAVGL